MMHFFRFCGYFRVMRMYGHMEFASSEVRGIAPRFTTNNTGDFSDDNTERCKPLMKNAFTFQHQNSYGSPAKLPWLLEISIRDFLYGFFTGERKSKINKYHYPNIEKPVRILHSI